MTLRVLTGRVVLPEGILPQGALVLEGGRIAWVGPQQQLPQQFPQAAGVEPDPVPQTADACWYLAPGFIDLHVHGGAGADFMDGTPEAWATALQVHLRHGTTACCPTTTAASPERIVRVLRCGQQWMAEHPPDAVEPACPGPEAAPGARVLGLHFYGPYFHPEARGCHPADPIRPPRPQEYEPLLERFGSLLAIASVAPELPGAKEFALACRRRGIRIHLGHTQATWDQVEEALGWGAAHVDHLYCAMSDKTKLRRQQTWPMRGGVLEAALYFDQLTTELISDGCHLAPELLKLAHKLKGPDRLALVTDCNRALEMPPGQYVFGPREEGEPFLHRHGVGLTLDGQALASSASGMDRIVRTFWQQTGVPLWQVIRMASLSPARMLGWDDRLGSLQVGKWADVLVLDSELNVLRVYQGGRCVYTR